MVPHPESRTETLHLSGRRSPAGIGLGWWADGPPAPRQRVARRVLCICTAPVHVCRGDHRCPASRALVHVGMRYIGILASQRAGARRVKLGARRSARPGGWVVGDSAPPCVVRKPVSLRATDRISPAREVPTPAARGAACFAGARACRPRSRVGQDAAGLAARHRRGAPPRAPSARVPATLVAGREAAGGPSPREARGHAIGRRRRGCLRPTASLRAHARGIRVAPPPQLARRPSI
jgi:hypothetical protein